MTRRVLECFVALCLMLLGVACSKNEEAIQNSHDLKKTEAVYTVLASNTNTSATPHLDINIPARELKLIQNNKIIYRFPVAVGSPVYKTPVGPRAISQIIWNPWWLPPDSKWAEGAEKTPPGPGNPLGIVKMELGGTIRLHGTNKEYTVGTPASHGCMRMHEGDVRTLAWYFQSHFSDKTDPKLLDTYASHRTSSYWVSLNRPIPVSITYDVFAIEDGQFKMYPDFYGRVGDKKGAALAWLRSRGISTHSIDEKQLANVIKNSGADTAIVALNDLMPAKLLASNTHVPDPVDIGWQEEKSSRKKAKNSNLKNLKAFANGIF